MLLEQDPSRPTGTGGRRQVDVLQRYHVTEEGSVRRQTVDLDRLLARVVDDGRVTSGRRDVHPADGRHDVRTAHPSTQIEHLKTATLNC